jgi:hypothetical protein
MRCTASSCWFYSGVCGADSCSKPTAGRATIYATTSCIGKESGRPLSYASQIKGVVRIPLRKAFDWLGNGQTIGTHALFPPAYYDNGYKILLQSGVDFDAKAKYIGCINSVGT